MEIPESFREQFEKQYPNNDGRSFYRDESGYYHIHYDKWIDLIDDCRWLNSDPDAPRICSTKVSSEQLDNALNGTKRYVDDILDMEAEVKHGGRGERWKTESAVAGGRVNVPASIKGVPNNRVNLTREKSQTGDKFVDIVVNTACSQSGSNMQKHKGGILCAMIQELEDRGIQCSVRVEKFVSSCGNKCLIEVPIKDYNQYLDRDVLAFVLMDVHGFNYGLMHAVQNMHGAVKDHNSKCSSACGPIPVPDNVDYSDVIYAPAIATNVDVVDWADKDAVIDYYQEQVSQQGIDIDLRE